MSRVISSVAGTRTEPKDGYIFIRGTTATFKIIFTVDGRPTKVDTNSIPEAKILQPAFLNQGNTPVPNVVATLQGSLVPGQDFEYQFSWDITINQVPLDNYIISYQGILGGQSFNFGDEFFTISVTPGMIGTVSPMYATVDDVRKKKFNIDTYLPEAFRKDLNSRNQLIEEHLRDASERLREELNLNQARGNTANNRLFCVYYTVWTLLLAARGEDGSAVSDQNLLFWRNEWERILAVEKRRGVMQGVPMGRG
jgi:hypothetical protein